METNNFTTAALINHMVRRADRPVSEDEILFLGILCRKVHGANVLAGWWKDLHTGEDMHGKRNIGEMLCLVHSEVAEADEGFDADAKDDKLPHRSALEVELADTLIRTFDLGGSDDRYDFPNCYKNPLLDIDLPPGSNSYQVREDLMLIHRAISKAMEGHRKSKVVDGKLVFSIHMAEVIQRIFWLGKKLNLDLGGAFVEKMAFNASRADHKPEARLAAGGKAY